MRAKRRALLVGCALGAAAIIAGDPQQASGQAFQANPGMVKGSVNRLVTGPTSEIITISSDTAIITWFPNSDTNPFPFLPAGNVATFTNGAAITDFVVLNRIASAQRMLFDGTVISRLQTGSGDVPGGTLLFAGPGGILVGPTALFDVGNLVLTTLTVATLDEEGAGPYLVPGDFQFSLGDVPPTAIVTQAGARFNATGENSYVAMVAPRIVHAGAADVNGSTAYIAGEQLQFTVNDGLFDIVVTTGTANADPLDHSGSTGGPASTGGTDNHRIYMVALPKNQAITALLTGDVGFAAASDVSIENGAIILSAGFNVLGDFVDRGSAPGQNASFLVRDSDVTSDLSGYAATDMFAGGGTGTLTFDQDVSLFADGRARLFAAPGRTVTVAGDALVSAARSEASDPTVVDVIGGEALAFAQAGGVLSVSGDIVVDASANAEGGDGLAGNGGGGTARLFADGGEIEVSGDATLLANGTGYSSMVYAAGDGTGGTVAVAGSNGGSVTIGGNLVAAADGQGGLVQLATTEAGSGTGGTASVVANGGSVVIGGGADISARGAGGELVLPDAGLAGAPGAGGAVTISAADKGAVTIGGNASLDATGEGGGGALGGIGGAGQGGDASISVADAQVQTGPATLLAQGIGGAGGIGDSALSEGIGGGGGEGRGGEALVVVGSSGILAADALLADTLGRGGTGGVGAVGDGVPAAGGAGGTGSGGVAAVDADGGEIAIAAAGDLVLLAAGTGGDGGAGGGPPADGGRGGDGSGGAARLTTDQSSLVVGGDTRLDAGGDGGSGSDGGSGAGGDATAAFAGSGIDLGDLTVDVEGIGGTPSLLLSNGGDGGDGVGGTVRLTVGDGDVAAGALDIRAGGFGGFGAAAFELADGSPRTGGNGGEGRGGDILGEALSGGTLSLTDSSPLGASGQGGIGGLGSSGDAAGDGGLGGDAAGGVVEVRTSGGRIEIVTELALSALAFAGEGGLGGDAAGGGEAGGNGGGGGQAAGGSARLLSVTGEVDAATAVILMGSDASGGVGGAGGTGTTGGAGGAGGDGSGGSARLGSPGGTLTAGEATLAANGLGGDGGPGGGGTAADGAGGDGGDGIGGSDRDGSTGGAYLISEGGNLSVGLAAVVAFGFGGDGGAGGTGGAGGNGLGGLAQFLAFAGTADMTGLLQVFTNGGGGAGGAAVSGGPAGGSGGDGGNGIGGSSLIMARGGASTDLDAADALLLANGSGGDGGAGAFGASTGGAGGRGGGGAGGVALIAADAGRLATDNVELVATGSGGDGGAGGGSGGGTGRGGSGGDGALGDGGTARIGSAGGVAELASVDLTANGLGGNGGSGGSAAVDGADGANVASLGGVAEIHAGPDPASGAVGSLTMGAARLTLLGDGGGVIAIAADGVPADIASLDVVGRGIDMASVHAENAVLRVNGPATFDIGGDVFVFSLGEGRIVVGGMVQLDVSGSIVAGRTPDDAPAASDLRFDSLFAVAGEDYRGSGATIRAAGAIDILAPGAVEAGTLVAGGDIRIGGGSIDLADGTAGGDIDLASPGDIVVGSAAAGDDFLANAGGSFTADTVTANAGSDILVDAAGDLRLDNGQASGTIRLTSSGASVRSAGRLQAGTELQASAAGDIALIEAGAGRDILLAADGSIEVDLAEAGDDFSAVAGGAFTGGNLIATGIGPDSDAGSGPLAGSGNIFVEASGDLRLDDADAAGGLRLASLAGAILSDGTLTAAQLDATAASNLALAGVVVTGDLDLSAPNGAITGASFDSGGSIALDASGAIVLATATAAGDIAADAARVELGAAVAGGDIDLAGQGDLRLDDGTAAGRIGLASAGGSIFSAGTLRAAGLDVQVGSDLRLNDVVVTDDLILSAPNGAIAGNRFASRGRIDLEASGAVVVAAVDAETDVAIAGASIDLAAATADGDVGLDSAGALIVGSVEAGGGFAARSGGDSAFGAISAGSATIQSAGAAAFNGAVLAETISIGSADIDVSPSGSLGGAGTELVLLMPLAGVQQTVLGGSTEGSGYTLTEAEAGRITAEILRLQAPPGAAGGADLLVRDLLLDGARVGLLDILVGGTVQIEGALQLAGAGAGHAIAIAADERLQIVTPTGSVRLLDDGGMPVGTLTIRANDIWSASPILIGRLTADPAFAGRDVLLRTNDGPFAPRGHIEAGAVALFARDSILVQNSGGPANLAGITVIGGLTLTPTGVAPLDVYAFGRRIDPASGFVTNSAFFGEVGFARGTAGYPDEAQFNLCFINSGICNAPDAPLPDGSDPTRGPFDVPGPAEIRDELIDASFSAEPLIEEPVTSGADPILWVCEEDEEGDCLDPARDD